MNLTGILDRGIVIQLHLDVTARIVVVAVSGIALTGAVIFSKRGSIVNEESMREANRPAAETPRILGFASALSQPELDTCAAQWVAF